MSDMCCRSLLPSLLDLLWQPSEDRRGIAATSLTQLCDEAPDVVISAMLTSPNDIMGSLLTHLSGDDSLSNRSSYAALIAACALKCDAAALQRIGDSGAVPYLLKLLKQADEDDIKIRILFCLEVSGL